MRIVDGMVVTEVGDSWVAVATGPAAERLHGVVRLNKTAKVVWDALAEGLGEREATRRLCERFDVDEEHAAASVSRLVAELADAGLLVE